MRSTFKVLFYVKKGSEKPNGNLPLMCRITVDVEIKQFSCKMDVPPRLWDVKNLTVDRLQTFFDGNKTSNGSIKALRLVVGFTHEQTAHLMTGKPLPYNGELYSDEHRRKFKTNDVTAKVGTNNGKLILAIDGLHIGE